MISLDTVIVGDVVDLSAVFSEPGSDFRNVVEGKVTRITEDKVLVMADNGQEINLNSLSEAFFPIPILRDSKWGFANNQGVIILPFDYSSAGPFVHGRAAVSLESIPFNRDFYINERGEWVDVFVEPQDGDMPVFVLQDEGKLGTQIGCETVLGIFSRFTDASSHLGQLRRLFEPDFFDEIPPVLFDQKDCYWDANHYLTIRKRFVPAVNKGSLIYSVVNTMKANVIDISQPPEFFSSKKDLLDYLSMMVGSMNPMGLADLDQREGQTESEEYSIGVFCLQ